MQKQRNIFVVFVLVAAFVVLGSALVFAAEAASYRNLRCDVVIVNGRVMDPLTRLDVVATRPKPLALLMHQG